GAVVAVLGRADEPWSWGGLPTALPPFDYRLDPQPALPDMAALGWALGSYRFTRYKPVDRPLARLAWPDGADRAAVERAYRAVALTRDMINTPAADMGPAELELTARAVATDHGATIETVVGHELAACFPAVHAVGRASPRAPRLIDLRWGDPEHPKVTLVGKGVCFDSGGLDIKPSSGMLNMKKDMGGAAHALALARMVMAAELPVRLRLLIPAVENVIDGSAFKPMDILKTRKGLTVEVGNTDAEGRLILCDALAAACEETPELLIDFATLTGAARVALGPDLPALFCNDDQLAADLTAAGERTHDPMWRLPLWKPYAKGLEGKISDLSSTGGSAFAGAIYAALFLERFVAKGVAWAHFDIYAWNQSRRPGRPEGGEAMTLRAVFDMLRARYKP
ncbi:MAG TPA: leucyl aminopeptidase family protein, partial [Azospirillaceae bacterium]|nr:leucyl aminopeptidase family protein [Azospirillaceae bacterium]